MKFRQRGAGDAVVVYLDRGRLVGTLHTGQGDEAEEALRRLIHEGIRTLDASLLADETVPVDEAVRETAAA